MSASDYHGERPHGDRVFSFGRLSEVEPEKILAHLCDPRIARHLPLLPRCPDRDFVAQLVTAKEASWRQDGLGHWAILYRNEYAGWGGFQREDGMWDFGLVLRPEYFRCGQAVARQALDWAREHTAIEEVSFLLPLSRSDRALARIGAEPQGVVEQSGTSFRKWTLSLRSRKRTG